MDLFFELSFNGTKVQPYHINLTYGSSMIFHEIKLTHMVAPLDTLKTYSEVTSNLLLEAI